MRQIRAKPADAMTNTFNKNRPIPNRSVLTGEALWKALGFKNVRAFQRARAAKQIEVALYPIPGQSRGLFAFQAEVEQLTTPQPEMKGVTPRFTPLQKPKRRPPMTRR